ncbi:uncharacterized protein LOC127102878 [Lathyrus oleraceus]|uniref:uncharacterized protein LOC127102878 n=1 Tax=Pisum sativum TaxID=3888 RepID=UPI0021D28C8C|nr:uncharacterized protein LOC127102878 [Pisum sativum]
MSYFKDAQKIIEDDSSDQWGRMVETAENMNRAGLGFQRGSSHVKAEDVQPSFCSRGFIHGFRVLHSGIRAGRSIRPGFDIMAGRNDRIIVDALDSVAQRNNSLMFKSEYDLEGAQRLEVVGVEITWVIFRVKFLEKYFPEDVCSKKEIEFLELKQGNMTVVEYAAKLEELVKFYPYNTGAVVEGSKCIKFENRMRPKIKRGIYDEDCRACSAHYKSVSERKGRDQYHGKSYSPPAERGKQSVVDEKNPSGGETISSIKCFKFDELGHRSNEYRNNVLRCFKCGKIGHHITGCKSVRPTCYNCGEQGHISTIFKNRRRHSLGEKALVC